MCMIIFIYTLGNWDAPLPRCLKQNIPGAISEGAGEIDPNPPGFHWQQPETQERSENIRSPPICCFVPVSERWTVGILGDVVWFLHLHYIILLTV